MLKSLGLGALAGIGGQAALTLDPSRYAESKAAHRLAVVVAEETERERATERANEPPRVEGEGLGLLSSLDAPFVYRPSETTEWHAYLARVSVLRRCAARLAMRESELAQTVVSMLLPPNWGEFFWMANYFDAVDDQVDLLTQAMHRHAEHDAQAVERYRKAHASIAGRASGASRAERARVTAAQVHQAWDQLAASRANERGIAGILGKRFKVDASYILKLRKEKPD